MNHFAIYFQLGFNHIATWGALDHILFIAALALPYNFSDWKKLLVLVTAFTIGHTITLGLCVSDVFTFSKDWIEFFIPLTIVITAIINVFTIKNISNNKFPPKYWMAILFGFIHGLGFSNDLKSIIGKDSNLFIKLLSANLGIEIAQIFFILAVLFIGAICTGLVKINKRDYLVFTSGTIFGTSLYFLFQRLPI